MSKNNDDYSGSLMAITSACIFLGLIGGGPMGANCTENCRFIFVLYNNSKFGST